MRRALSLPRPPPAAPAVSRLTTDVFCAAEANLNFNKEMQDAHVMLDPLPGVDGCALFAVYDGHGGCDCAWLTSAHLHTAITRELLREASARAGQTVSEESPIDLSVVDPALAVRRAFHMHDRAMSDVQSCDLSGATATVALLMRDTRGGGFGDPAGGAPGGALPLPRVLIMAHVGDSRAVLARSRGPDPPPYTPPHSGYGGLPHTAAPTYGPPGHGGVRPYPVSSVAPCLSGPGLMTTAAPVPGPCDPPGSQLVAVRLTHDHTALDPVEVRLCTERGGFIGNGRVNNILAVTRAFGDFAIKPPVTPSPTITALTLTPLDEFLIIACDGLWDVVDDAEAVALVAGLGDGDAARGAEILVAEAVRRGSQDNITCMVVMF
jgi:serine/threonine protein phosphatase PrpC